MKSTKIGSGYYRINTEENVYDLIKSEHLKKWVLINKIKHTKEYFYSKKDAMLNIK